MSGKQFQDILSLNCVREGVRDEPLILKLSPVYKSQELYLRTNPWLLLSASFQDLGIWHENALGFRREYIEMISNHIRIDKHPAPPPFIITLSPQYRGFFMAPEDISIFPRPLELRDDLGGWEVGDYSDLIKFCNNGGEAFIIEINKPVRSSNFKVFIPEIADSFVTHKEKKSLSSADIELMKDFCASTTGTDRAFRTLQAGSQVFISLRRKRLHNEIFNVVHIEKISS